MLKVNLGGKKANKKQTQNQSNTYNCLINISIIKGKKICFVENEEYINVKN